MGAAYFYHLTRGPLEATLPVLLEKALERGWRIAVRARSEAVLERLDEVLWLREGFLPHGCAGGPRDADQPVLLSTGRAAANAATCLMAVDGAEVGADEVAALDRVCILFDGRDPAAVEAARAQWRALTGAGAAAQYWSEESGRWEKKADSAAS